MSKNHALSDQISVWHFDGDILIFSDGSLGAGFKIEGIDTSSASVEEINEYGRKLEEIPVSLPEGTSIQFRYQMSRDSEKIIERHRQASSHGNEACRKIARHRIEFMREQQKSGRHFSPSLFLFLRSRPIRHKKASLFARSDRFLSVSKEEYESRKKSFERTIKRLESAADFLGPKTLSRREWFSLLFEHFNLDRKERIGEPQLREMESLFSPTLTEQFLLTDVRVCADSLKIGQYHFAAVTLKNLPEGMTWASMGNILTGMPLHFWLIQNVHIPDQKSEMSGLQMERRLSHSMVSGGRNMDDLESESKLADTEELARELIEGSEKLVSSDLAVIVWAKNRRELAEKEDEVLKAFRSMGGAEGVRETLPLFDIFTGIFPGSCRGLRMKKMKSSNAADMMPVHSWWKGNQNTVCLLPNREGVPFALDPFAPELPNWNTLIFGGSGSGKSFAVAQLMLQFCGQNPTPKIVWMDNGESSHKLTEVLDGEFVGLSLDSGICVNMFDLEPGETTPDGSKVRLIMTVLESILKEDGSGGIPKREKALLEESVLKVYETAKGKTPRLSDLREILASHDAVELRT